MFVGALGCLHRASYTVLYEPQPLYDSSHYRPCVWLGFLPPWVATSAGSLSQYLTPGHSGTCFTLLPSLGRTHICVTLDEGHSLSLRLCSGGGDKKPKVVHLCVQCGSLWDTQERDRQTHTPDTVNLGCFKTPDIASNYHQRHMALSAP